MEKITLSHKEFCSHFVVFQRKYMRLENLLNFYNDKLQGVESDEYVEVLPSIYLKCKVTVKKADFKGRIRNSFFKILKIEPSYYEILQRTTYHFEFDIRNIRDSFRIVDENSTDTVTTEKWLGDKEIKDELRYVHSDELIYPNSLGSGAGNCGIWYIFRKNGLFTTMDRAYSLFDLSTLMEITSYRPEYLDTICLMGKTCSKIIPLMRNGDFLPGYLSGTDDIETEFNGSKYITSEGKHRTCAAKKMKLNSVPVMTYIPATVKGIYGNTYCKGFEKDCEDILKTCYGLFEQIGLTKEDVQYLNEHITNDLYIQYIEEKTGKRFEEIKIKDKGLYSFDLE